MDNGNTVEEVAVCEAVENIAPEGVATLEDLKQSITQGKPLPKTPTISADEAKKLIAQDAVARQKQFLDGYRKLVNDTGYALEPRVVITPDGTKAELQTKQLR